MSKHKQTHESTPITTGQTETEDVAIPVREESLVAGTRTVEQGQVHLHKDVVTEQQSLTVPVTHEQVSVERRPVSGNATVTEDAFVEGDIEVPVMGEQVVTSKQARVVEEVRLHKDTVTEQQQVSDTVRKEQVVVDGADTRPQTPLATERTRR